MQRKVILIDEEWVEVINKLKEKFSVYGLIQMNTGAFGNIPSMHDWWYKELKELGIEFSDNKKLAIYNSGQKDDAIFYKGIFITGNYSKSGTLSKVSEELNASLLYLLMIVRSILKM